MFLALGAYPPEAHLYTEQLEPHPGILRKVDLGVNTDIFDSVASLADEMRVGAGPAVETALARDLQNPDLTGVAQLSKSLVHRTE